ncbi:hypothetical protein O4H48_14025 [Rhodobacteraceae bacterium G21628-S1]|nr:hypothetical protein [Rhodobacteraceae bacterium G21628-S1]
MAAKKKDAGKVIVAFVLRDFKEGEGDEAITLTGGQRLELSQDEFAALAKRGVVAEGVFVKMKTAVEGGRYSLKPHDSTWLPPHVYEAWKAAGYCEPSEDDPEVGAVLKARDEAARDATNARDIALARCDELDASLKEANLQLLAARAQAEKLRDLIQPEPDSGDVLDDETAALLGEVLALIDMFPEQLDAEEPSSSEPQLNLD